MNIYDIIRQVGLAGMEFQTIEDMLPKDTIHFQERAKIKAEVDTLNNITHLAASAFAMKASLLMDALKVQGFTREEAVQIIARNLKD